MKKLSRNARVGLVAAGAVVVAILAFGVFGVQTLFIDKKVDEANPFAASASTTTTVPDDATIDEDPAPSEDPADEPDTTEAPAPAEPAIQTLSAGQFTDGDHPTSGTGTILTDGNASFLRFEDFETDNGPDLNVYLRSSADPDDYIDLGDLKGNIGDQNYELTSDIDTSTYDLVDIWCVRFGVSFGTAQLIG